MDVAAKIRKGTFQHEEEVVLAQEAEIQRLHDEVTRLRQEIKGTFVVLAYAIKQSGGKLEVTDDFIRDFSHADIELISEHSPFNMAWVYRARTKSNSYGYFK